MADVDLSSHVSTSAKSATTGVRSPLHDARPPPQTRAVGRHELSSLSTLATKIRCQGSADPHYALFLGAGASLSSGIPSGERLVQRWKREILTELRGNNPTDEEFTDWLQQQPPERITPTEDDVRRSFAAWRRLQEEEHGRHASEYSLLFTHFHKSRSDRQQYIETLVDGLEPGPGYIYLASLVPAGRFRIVLTTNFDDLIHDALFRYAGAKPLMCAFDSQVGSIRLGSWRPKILKLHGDFLYDNVRNTSRETERLGPNMEDKLRASCMERGLIVIGYAGADASVMGPLRELLEQRSSALCFGLHWCLYEPSTSGPVHVPEALYHLLRSFPERVHLYATSGFDAVMERFYLACECEPPPLLAKPVERSLYHSLNNSLVKSEQRYHVSPVFNGILRKFMAAHFQRQVEAERLCEIADLEFQDARSQKVFLLRRLRGAQRSVATEKPGQLRTELADQALVRTLQEAVDHAVQAHAEALQAPERLDLAARARRRSSGALGEKAELHWHRHELAEAASNAETAIAHAQDGLDLAMKTEAFVQLRPLYYNALSGFSILHVTCDELKRRDLATRMGNEVRIWHGELKRRDPDGDDLRELQRDTPGWQFIEAILQSD